MTLIIDNQSSFVQWFCNLLDYEFQDERMLLTRKQQGYWRIYVFKIAPLSISCSLLDQGDLMLSLPSPPISAFLTESELFSSISSQPFRQLTTYYSKSVSNSHSLQSSRLTSKSITSETFHDEMMSSSNQH